MIVDELRAPHALTSRLSSPLLWVRGPLDGFGSPAKAAVVAAASGKDSLLLCMLDPPSARERPTTATTPMTWTRGMPDKGAKGSDAAKPEGGLDTGSARNRPATGTTPMTGTRGLAKAAPAAKSAPEDKPGDAAAKLAGDTPSPPAKQ